jgi:hypothetical protein
MAAFLLACTIVAELPWIKDGLEAVDRSRGLLFAIAAGVTTLGFVMMMGGILSMLMASEDPLEPAESDASSRVFGAAASAQVANEASFAGMKAAFRSGEWWADPQWRRLFIAGGGALLLFYGMFSLAFVLAPGPIRVLAAAAILYATAMTGWGVARAKENW